MIAFVVFLYKEFLFSEKIEYGKQITIGSHKKDDIHIENFFNNQIVIKWKANGISVQAKKAYNFEKEEVAFDNIIILDEETNAVLYISPLASKSEIELKLPYNCVYKIGREENDISINLPFVSSNHLILKNENGNVRVEDQDSTNGTYLNGRKISIAKMKSGDVLSILSVQIKLLNGVLYFYNVGDKLNVDKAKNKAIGADSALDENSLFLKYHRSPRMQEQLPTEDIILANAPTKAQKFEKNRGMFSSLAGTGAMFAANMFVSAASPALLAARAASLVSPIASMASSKSVNKKRKMSLEQYEAMRREKYGAYIIDQKARIESVAKVQRDIISKENPTPKECIEILYGLKRNLWERMPSDRDFLDVRIGMGYESLCVDVKSRNDSNGFQMESDEIRELSEQIIEETRIVDNVPARISLLKKNTIGFVGDRNKVIRLVKNMLISLTTTHCYDDVRVVGIFDKNEQEIWESLKWLPHIWDDNKQFRTLAFDKDNAHNLCEMFNDVLKKRKEEIRDNSYSQKSIPKPYYIFVFGSKDMVEKEELMHNLFGNDSAMGITSLFLFDNLYMLPNDCKCIVDVDNGPCVFDRSESNNKFYFTMDANTDNAQWDSFARRMSAVQLEGFAEKSSLPNGITFLRGYGVQKVEQLNIIDRWNTSVSYETLAAPIGMLSGNKIFNFDIHEKKHGPHGLVAGTTGSGKSEVLLTWILSMALNYHPHDVNFVIIDYKGGGMANRIEKLPHVVGKITDISSNIGRSLISLKSELDRRKRILDECKVDHVHKYQKLYKSGKASEPLPHLIIVADEFAELKKEEPEFMKELNSVARVGRTLGIHLVLATQKPGGLVDEQIQSNSNFRLCLKVQDVNDSREMIKRPDAVKLTQAGRTYIRVGEDDYFDLFQSFWSGASYTSAVNEKENTGNQVYVVDVNGKRIKTIPDKKPESEIDELKAIVSYVANVAKENGIEKLQGPWLTELSEELYLDEIKESSSFDGVKWSGNIQWLTVPIGKYDAPALQSQGTQFMDLALGHYGIYGGPGTGKTTLLKTIVLSLGLHYSPEDVNIYILDCGGWSMNMFNGMPHVGGVALDSEEEKFVKFEKLILEEFEFRKKIFLQNSVSSLKSYREAVSNDIPAIIIAIDNFNPIFDLYPDLENLFVTIARDGATFGIYLVYTANSTSGVRYKVLQNISGAVAFELTDKGDYATIVGRLEGMTLPKVMGRAFYKGNPPIEFQSAMFSKGNNDKERLLEVKELIGQMNSAWIGKRPKPIPVMPEIVSYENMVNEYSIRTSIPLGISCDNISTAYAELEDNYSFLISGSVHSGKSRMLSQMVNIVLNNFSDTKVFVFDSSSKSQCDLEHTAYKYTDVSNDETVTEILNEIVDHLNNRKKSQNQSRQIDVNDFDEKQFINRYELLCIAIDDIKEFVDSVSDANKNTMERICRMAGNLGVIVLCAGRITDISKYNEIESLTRVIVGYQNGLAMDGTPAQHNYFQNTLKYSERDLEAGEGFAYLFNNGKCIKIKTIS